MGVAASLKTTVACLGFGAALCGQDGQVLLHRMQNALGGAGRIAVGPGDTYVLYFDGTSGWEVLPGKHLTDLMGGELNFARNYLSGFMLNTWLTD